MPIQSITLGKNITELTLINPIVPGKEEPLRLFLAALQAKIESGQDTPISKISTIHYARWAIIDHKDGKALLFESNFDGTWEGYLNDFSVLIPNGLDAIWGNCVGYPAGGCKDFPAFKLWVAQYQIEVNVYYAAYPEATVKRVKRALEVLDLVNDFTSKL